MQTRASTPTDLAVPGDGIRLHARDWGGSGQAVVLLHGLASNARIWDGVAPRLTGAGLRVVALDLRGHGASDQPASATTSTLVRDLDAALAALDLERPLLVGHSWGRTSPSSARPIGRGRWPASPWSTAPWRACPRGRARPGGGPPQLARPGSRSAGRLAGPGRALRHRRVGRPAVGPVPARRGRGRRPRRGPFPFHFDNHMQVVDALWDQRPEALFPLVDCPVLLCPADGSLAGVKRDAVARAVALFPSATVTWFEDTMHDIPLQRPVELAADLARFADRAKEVSGRG